MFLSDPARSGREIMRAGNHFFSAETRMLKQSGCIGTVISTHLPPPVIIERTAPRRWDPQ